MKYKDCFVSDLCQESYCEKCEVYNSYKKLIKAKIIYQKKINKLAEELEKIEIKEINKK